MLMHDVLDTVCRMTDLCLYEKKFKATRDDQEAFYAIKQQQLGTNHINVTVSKAENSIQISIYDGKKNGNSSMSSTSNSQEPEDVWVSVSVCSGKCPFSAEWNTVRQVVKPDCSNAFKP